jgi:REP element-mobilizing transposase RayT
MARKPRIYLPGGFYHVILRGNSRQDIFRTVSDRQTWEYLLCRGLQRYDHRIHAFCWMTNHVHMALQAGTTPISNFISSVASNYARRFNIRTRRSGHLFERRHKAILVNKDEYLLELIRYIHMNPVRARLVEECGDYRWSSHHTYTGSQACDWLTRATILKMFGETVGGARRRYAQFMNEPQPNRVLELFRKGKKEDDRILGDDKWSANVTGEQPDQKDLRTLDELLQSHCEANNIDLATLQGRSCARYLCRLRAEVALTAVDNKIASLSEVARALHRSQPALSKAVQRFRLSGRKL